MSILRLAAILDLWLKDWLVESFHFADDKRHFGGCHFDRNVLTGLHQESPISHCLFTKSWWLFLLSSVATC